MKSSHDSGRRWRSGGALRRALAGVFAVLGLAARAECGPDVVVAMDDSRSCRVHGTFSAAVSRAVAWAVLADYDSIGRFVPSVRSSRLERLPDGRLRLHQEAVSSMFLVRKQVKVVLDIQEEPGVRIGFRDVLGQDFRSYEGEWRIAPDSAGTRVEYRVEADPSSSLARVMCRGVLKHNAQDLLGQVRREMLRRAALDSVPSAGGR